MEEDRGNVENVESGMGGGGDGRRRGKNSGRVGALDWCMGAQRG